MQYERKPFFLVVVPVPMAALGLITSYCSGKEPAL